MNYSDPYNAETLTMRTVFNQFTMDLVDDLKQKSGQTDNTATVVVGVGIGMLVSAGIVFVLWCIARCSPLLARRIRDAPGTVAVTRVVNNVELDTETDDHQCGSPNSNTVYSTEGAYRSDSEESDEEEGAKAAKEAQRRSHKSGTV
jgi:hypothetical protein